MSSNNDHGKVSSEESIDPTAQSHERRANAKAKLDENRFFSVVYRIFQKELRFESVSLKKHYVEPDLVHTHYLSHCIGIFPRKRFFIASTLRYSICPWNN